MPTLDRICVFCASSPGNDPELTAATVELGRLLAERGHGLVYGGGAVGLMGVVADTVMDNGGRVTGVIPSKLFSREVGHRGLTELIEVDTMHERKALMYQLSDAFIALPGGFGTLEELAETLTWSQLGLHAKPIGVLDVGGFWQPLLDLMARAVERELLKPTNRDLLVSRRDPAALLDGLADQRPVREPKWIGDDRI